MFKNKCLEVFFSYPSKEKLHKATQEKDRHIKDFLFCANIISTRVLAENKSMLKYKK